MARRKLRTPDGPSLYEYQERTETRRLRRQRALFIPRFLQEAAKTSLLSGADQDRAYAIAVRWADLESSGHLAKHKETSIDTQFLDQLFGEGLGYGVKTTHPTGWELEHKFTVPGVGTADAALGEFPKARSPTVVVELKDALTDLDRDRSSGRTAVQQCWDYLNALPECPWGIVANFSTIRLYHRSRGALAYEEFTLQELRDRDRFNEFYCLFERGGLLPSRIGQRPRAAALLERTRTRQKEVGDELYKEYQLQRLRLIEHLKVKHGKSLDAAIRIAQKLMDRIIFIAFCEDRELLPANCLKRTTEQLSPFVRATNPRWQNFLGLFHQMDRGSGEDGVIPAFNGGLFAEDAEIDQLNLNDVPWAYALADFGRYDFSEEVNVEVLGHLFERSITELEKLRVGGLFALKGAVEQANGHANGASATRPAKGKAKKPAAADEDSPLSKMPKSAQRKRFGIYYTPPAFTGLIVEHTVDALVKERFAALADKHQVDPESRETQNPQKLRAYWSACLECLKALTVCDPACGSGAFLIRAYDALDAHYKAVVHGLGGSGILPEELSAIEESIPDLILAYNLYGVDLSQEAVEITQLALWIRSARRGKTLADLSSHIVWGNSLVADPAVDPKALDWAEAFPAIFDEGGRGGFDCVIGNPPWERVKLQNREFFSVSAPAIAAARSSAHMGRMIAELKTSNAELFEAWEIAQASAERMSNYARQSGRFVLTGKGDVNLYALFAELAGSLVAPGGVVGLLVPSAIATHDKTKDFFSDLMDRKALVSLYDFENKEGHFEDLHRSFKFTALVFGGAAKQTEQADFVFFGHNVEEVAAHNKQRHIALTAADIARVNPNSKTCPIFRSRRDAALTKGIYQRVPILIDEGRAKGGNSWGIQFVRMLDQSSDSDKFVDARWCKKNGYVLERNVWRRQRKRYMPLYEAKMIQAFDHRASSVLEEGANTIRTGQKVETTPVQHSNPEYYVMPRWWVSERVIEQVMEERRQPFYLCYKRISSATNERTVIASFVPDAGIAHPSPILLVDSTIAPRAACCLLANLNAFALDYVARQKLGSTDLDYFVMKQLPTLPPDVYADKCPWSKRETLEHWISERVLKLSCTAEDMIPLADACGFKGSRGDGVHIWKEQERATLRAELDAAYFHLYGVEREDAEYMLSTFTNTGLIPEDERQKQTDLWTGGSIAEMTLDAYDKLSPLASGG